MPKRSFLENLGWTVRDYAKRVWDNSGEDNVLFLAGGIAFNLILAAVPFALLMTTGVTYLLPHIYPGQIDSLVAVQEFIDRLLPAHDETSAQSLHKLIADMLRTRGSVTVYSAIGFVWFSTRLFGSLRTVLASVFDIESERGIIAGKIFDIQITVIGVLLFVASSAVTAYITLATKGGVQVLENLGITPDVNSTEYLVGRFVAFIFMALMFFSLYKYLPIRRVRARTAWVAALFTSICFEGARTAFSYYSQTFNPGSLYTTTLAVLIVVVVWFYYASVIFILGGEVGQVYELRRMRHMQREVFSE